jgi:hypothetical protein
VLKIDKTDVYGWEAAIRGMRNPKNSWSKSDSYTKYFYNEENCETYSEFIFGENDLKLMKQLASAGDDHGKFMRMINVTCDIVAPLYWWKEFDTYKVGTVADSCSTMHKIHDKKFDVYDFSHEHLLCEPEAFWYRNSTGLLSCSTFEFCQITCNILNHYRDLYLQTKNKEHWWQMIQLLPSSYNQKRTVQMNYQVLKHMYHARNTHKLDEWHTFCDWITTLPNSELITGETEWEI